MELIDEKDYLDNSVQFRATDSQYPDSGSLLQHIWLEGDELRPLPQWWTPSRDRFLRNFVNENPILSSITYGRVTAIKNLDWKIIAEDSNLKDKLDYYYEMFSNAQFYNGFRRFLSLYAIDNYTQDNGSFVELIGEGKEQYFTDEYGNRFLAKHELSKEKITGFASLDSQQCFRTYNHDYPVVYTNPYTGQKNILHKSRVIAIAQFPQNYELGRGIGICATSRAFDALQIINVSNQYVIEKMTGHSPALAIANGVSMEAIRQALDDNTISRDNRGLTRYKGTAMIQGDSIAGVNPSIAVHNLKAESEGWNREDEVTLALYIIAMAYGTDARDMGFPAVQRGATKADAEISDIKTSGRGRADIIKDLEEVLTRRILPRGLRFEFDNQDLLTDQHKEQIAKLRAEMRQIQVTTGEISALEARQIAVSSGDIPEEVIDTNQVQEGDTNISDDDSQQMDILSLFKDLESDQQFFVDRMDRAITFYQLTGNEQILTNNLATAIQNGIRISFFNGLSDGGYKSTALQKTQQETLNNFTDSQLSYLDNLILFANSEPDSQAIANRISLWKNKAFNEAYNLGKLSAKVDKMYGWRLGITEHCTTCLEASKQVHTAIQWRKSGIYPQSNMLECGGFNCQCELVETDESPKGDIEAIPIGKGKSLDFKSMSYG